jgi:hypothetical protein
MMGRHTARPAFSLLECAVASIILALLAGATVNAVGSTVKARRIEADRARARGLAADLIGEIAGQLYEEPGVVTTVLGPETGDGAGPSRLLYDDVDDYNGLKETPPTQRDGTPIAGLTNWKRQTVVDWVVAGSLAVSATETGIKRVTVSVSFNGKPLATAVALRSKAWDKAGNTNISVSVPNDVAAVGPTP